MRRNDHAAVCLWNGVDYPQLLVIGGLDENVKVLNDAWILNLQTRRWKEVRNHPDLISFSYSIGQGWKISVSTQQILLVTWSLSTGRLA